MTYRQVDDLSSRFAQALVSLGLEERGQGRHLHAEHASVRPFVLRHPKGRRGRSPAARCTRPRSSNSSSGTLAPLSWSRRTTS